MAKRKEGIPIMKHLAMIALARILYKKMNFFEKRKIKKFDVRKYEILCNEKIKILDKYSFFLDEWEKNFYEKNKDAILFRIGFSARL